MLQHQSPLVSSSTVAAFWVHLRRITVSIFGIFCFLAKLEKGQQSVVWQKKRKTADPEVFCYLTRIKVIVGIITALLAALIPVSWMDKSAWINEVPVIFLLLLPIVFYFVWTLWQDGNTKVTVSKESVHWVKGHGRFRKDVEIPFSEVAEFRDATTIFSISRKYTVVSNDAEPKRIQLSSAIGGYRDLLNRILARVPKGVVSDRAKKSLARARVKSF